MVSKPLSQITAARSFPGVTISLESHVRVVDGLEDYTPSRAIELTSIAHFEAQVVPEDGTTPANHRSVQNR